MRKYLKSMATVNALCRFAGKFLLYRRDDYG